MHVTVTPITREMVLFAPRNVIAEMSQKFVTATPIVSQPHLAGSAFVVTVIWATEQNAMKWLK